MAAKVFAADDCTCYSSTLATARLALGLTTLATLKSDYFK